jgi:hypothetical protein
MGDVIGAARTPGGAASPPRSEFMFMTPQKAGERPVPLERYDDPAATEALSGARQRPREVRYVEREHRAGIASIASPWRGRARAAEMPPEDRPL